jgi:hypothetical protein
MFPVLPTETHNVDNEDHEKHGVEILSFVWRANIIESKYVDKFQWRDSNSSKKEHAMDKSWNKGTSASKIHLSIVLITKTGWNDCYAITFNPTTNPPSRSKRICPRPQRKKEAGKRSHGSR